MADQEFNAVLARAERAEAERDRMRELLDEQADWEAMEAELGARASRAEAALREIVERDIKFTESAANVYRNIARRALEARAMVEGDGPNGD
jgi:NACalpha-BTF3-like transcription factor